MKKSSHKFQTLIRGSPTDDWLNFFGSSWKGGKQKVAHKNKERKK